MLSTELSRPPRKRARLALAAALVAVGCSGGTGGGCGSSCGGAFRTKDDQGKPIKYTGTRLDNVAQLRVTTSGFTFLNAAHLNDVVGALNGDSSISQSFKAPATPSTLSFWYRVTCPSLTGHGYASAALHDNVADTTATVLTQTCTNTGAWVQMTPVALTPKHTYTLFLSNHDGADVSTATYTDYDDVAVTTLPAPATPIIVNGGFETNGLENWETAGTAELTSTSPHGGSSAARVGKVSPGFSIPCIDAGVLLNACVGSTGFHFHLLAGDSALSGDPATCATEKTPLHLTFKDVSWALDPTNNVLKAHLVMHLQTGDIYVRTVEEHSTLCNGTSAIQLRVVYNDELPGLPQQDTAADLSINFSTTPDGRLEFNFDDASLASVVANFQPAALVIDGHPGNDPAPPTSASYNGDGCGSGSGTYNTLNGSALNCAAFFDWINANCDFTQPNQPSYCGIIEYIRGYLFDFVKNSFKAQIVKILRSQLDNMRCQRSTTSQGGATKCDASHACPADDDGHALACDTGRGVCYPPAQGLGADGYNCEPIQLGISGTLDVDHLTQKVGFPPKSALNLFAGLGSKGVSGGAKVDANGLQLAVEAGTQPASDSNYIGVCVPPALPANPGTVPAMDFDDINNKPTTVTAYDFGFSLASAMLNRGFLDAYSAGMLCVAITNQTTAFISSGLFKTFLPSLGLVTGQKDVPMKILLRPTEPPFVRIGKNTYKTDSSGNQIPDDPLITLSFRKMNLDFYALVDERQVRIFTLQADLLLPLNLRALADPNAGTLQPVLGGLDTVLTNISALSPDGGPYSATTDMLAEDPGVVKDLLGAAVRLAQPLLAGVIKPVALPSMAGIKLSVRGIAGAVPMADIPTDGYSHLAIWAQAGACGGTTGVTCEEYTVKAQARVVRSSVPGTLKEVRDGARPELELELSALSARSGSHAQFSYRVDGSLWSAWLGSPRLTLRDPLFLVQGHHLVEVTAREAGEDLTADLHPVALDFFVSYESPEVSLVQRPDGAVITRAHSGSTPAEKLAFSYRIEGEQSWMQPGPARVFTEAELGGRGLSVSVSDEAGRATVAHFGDEVGPVARASVAGGCASPGASLWAVLGLAALALVRRQRKGSISAG